MAAWSKTVDVSSHEHVVSFYEDTDHLVAQVVPFLAEGLAVGDVVLIVATQRHRLAFTAALRAYDPSFGSEDNAGRVILLDARSTLEALSVRGRPDSERFAAVVGRQVNEVVRQGRRVRAYGEMVGLLWKEGAVQEAIELEAMWNGLCSESQLALWCGYEATAVADSDLASVAEVCSAHSSVVPPAMGVGVDSAADGTDLTERSRLFLPAPIAVRAVRRFVNETLSIWGLAGLSDDACLVASELATNALLHASSPFRMVLSFDDDTVKISVHDASVSAPTQFDQTDHAVNGRGVAIVAQLSSQWGTELRSDGKIVWAALNASA